MIERIKDRVCLTSVSVALDIAVAILGHIRKKDDLPTTVEAEERLRWTEAEAPHISSC